MIAALSRVPAWSVLVNGGARGADRLAAVYWTKLMRLWCSSAVPTGAKPDYYVETYRADWARYGNSAGPIRNQQMLDTGLDMLLAFPGGNGTANMIGICEGAGVPVVDGAWLAAQPGRLISGLEVAAAVPSFCRPGDRRQTVVAYEAAEPLKRWVFREPFTIQEQP